MSQAKKGKLNFRCPACFMRDIDIDMFYDEDKRTNGGFTSVLFLAGIMAVFVMWGIIAMAVFK